MSPSSFASFETIQSKIKEEIFFLDKYNSSSEKVLKRIEKEDLPSLFPILSNRNRLYQIIENLDFKIRNSYQILKGIEKDKIEILKELEEIKKEKIKDAYSNNQLIIQLLNNSYKTLEDQVFHFSKNKAKVASYYKNGAII